MIAKLGYPEFLPRAGLEALTPQVTFVYWIYHGTTPSSSK